MGKLAFLSSLSPFGPIFGKELRTTARRKRTYWLRFLYLLALFLVLLGVYSGASSGQSAGSVAERAQQEAELGGYFFIAFSMFSIFALPAISPILTATAVSTERQHKTLHVLLMTPITSWQIIAGKLFSRLLASLTLIGLSLPVLAVVRLLGGVEVNQMMSVLILCVVASLTAAAIGLFYSTFMNRAYAVILLSYATMLVIYAFVPFVIISTYARRGPSIGLIQSISAINPFASVMFTLTGQRLMRGISWVPCVIVHLSMTAALVACAAAVLRRIARREGESAATVAPQDYIPFAAVIAPAAAAEPEAVPATILDDVAGAVATVIPPPPPPRLPPPVPDARGGLSYASSTIPKSKPVKVREVSDNPVLWREIRRPLVTRRWQAIAGTIVCLAILLISYICIHAAGSPYNAKSVLGDGDIQIGYGFIFCGLMTLLICVLSATTIAGEKESDTWTLLLATPIHGREIVMGKLMGILRRLLWPSVLIFAHFTIFLLFGVIPLAAYILILWLLVAFNTVWIATGLYFSLKLRTVTFAVILNLLMPIAAYMLTPLVLLILANLAFNDRSDRLPEAMWYYAPYWYLGEGVSRLVREAQGQGMAWRQVEAPVTHDSLSSGAFFQLVFAVGVGYLVLSALMIGYTIRRFDRIVGRAPQRAT